MKNIPEVKLGIIAVSRDCFVISFQRNAGKRMVSAFGRAGSSIIEIQQLSRMKGRAQSR